jgi:hypothetical protein
MEDDLGDIIRRARKTVVAVENDGNRSSSMPETRHSSFDSSLKEKKGKYRSQTTQPADPSEVLPYQWSEAALRVSGSKLDRTLMAVRDAARVVAGNGSDPSSEAFYVASSIAKGWNLNSRQLSEGLKELEKGGHIVVTGRKKGRHLRMTLAPIRPP